MPDPIAHVSGPPCWPILGHTLDLLRDGYKLHGGAREKYGDIYKVNIAGRWNVTLSGADALEFVLGDKDGLFASKDGWHVLTRLFSGGLMLRDFDDHRANRRIMQSAFRKPVMDNYRDKMATALDQLLGQWPDDAVFAFFPAIKEMTLQMGASVFMGLPIDHPQVTRLNQAFQDEVTASLGIVRLPLPFTKMGRGVKARKYLTETFIAMIPERRSKGGDDFFSQMCTAQDEDGNSWTDAEIVDHFNFLLMAAHDTTASTLTKMVWAMGHYPEWQERMIAEIDALGDGAIDDAALATLDVTERVMKECLRMLPPVPFIPRRSTRAFTYKGITIPANTAVAITPGLVMMSPNHWTAPETFDPDRFSPNRAEDKSHRYAWAPFGGGAHKCIGLHFATMQIKIFMILLLRKRKVALALKQPVDWARVPIPQPKGGLPIRLIKRESAA